LSRLLEALSLDTAMSSLSDFDVYQTPLNSRYSSENLMALVKRWLSTEIYTIQAKK